MRPTVPAFQHWARICLQRIDGRAPFRGNLPDDFWWDCLEDAWADSACDDRNRRALRETGRYLVETTIGKGGLVAVEDGSRLGVFGVPENRRYRRPRP